MSIQRNNSRKFVASVVTATLVASAVAPFVNAASFSDVGSQYKNATDFLVSKGIQGLSNKEFGVHKPIKRVDAAVMIAKVLDLDITKAPPSGFTDVPTRAVPFVNALKAAGITTGKTKTTLDVHSLITRGELALWIQRGFNLKGTSKLQFTDVNKRYAEAVQALLDNGITKGITATQFGTDQNAKRGDYANLLKRAYDVTVPKESLVITNVKSISKTKVEVKLSSEVDEVTAANFSIDGAIVSKATLASDRKTITLEVSGLEYSKSYQIKAKGLKIKGKEQDEILSSFKTVAVTDLWNLSITTKASSLLANAQDSTEVKVQLIDKLTGLPDKNSGDITLELTSTFGTLSPSTVTLKDGEAVVSWKSASSQNDVTGTLNAKVTKTNDAYKELIGQIAGSTTLSFKGVKDSNTGESGNSGNSGNGGNNNKNFTMSLMHTNDTHAHLDNVAKRATAVKEVRAKKPNALLVDTGDVFSGTLYFNEFKGKADLAFMNAMKYDVMTFGNHEFDLGSTPEGHQALSEFVKGAEFPFVSSNVDFSKDQHMQGLATKSSTSNPQDGNIYNGIVKTINGEKVGFFGLITEETKDISSPGQITFSNYIDEAKKAVSSFEQQGINKIVALTHIGYDDNPTYDNDLTLATEVPGIDVIVGGHSHTQLDKPVVVSKDKAGKAKDPTVVVQAYQYSDYLGTVDVEFDAKGKVVGQAGELIKIVDKKEDPEIAKMLTTYSGKIDELKNKSTGSAATKALDNPRDGGDPTKPSVRKNETELGNLITDGMLDKAKEFNKDTVIALQNGGGIRAGIDQGDITLGDVLTVLPFGNTLATMELTGAEIIEALEHSVSQAPKESGGFLHVSGMKFTYDSSKPSGSRVQKVEVKNQDGSYSDLDITKKYVVATNAFTAKGGDGYTVFKKAYEAGRVTDLGLADWENLRDYAGKLKTVAPMKEDRIKDIKGTNPETPSELTPAEFNGSPSNPKTHTGNKTVDISGASSLGHAVVSGDLKIIGTPNQDFTITNVKVSGNLDLTGMRGKPINLDGIEVDGETKL
ncbi:5'-nucleotidase C-terminal domain-containing protein [Bacillus sp. JJ722]|uniref:5'-nucleotidase C-terminal domain-containing protein n=1 Tax=Bacillus sp. JJ722 TaxID=3122973 RepID=UPI002FFFBB91